MKKIKRLFKNYIILFITFSVINIFFIWIISSIVGIEGKLKSENTLLGDTAKNIMINTTYEVTNKEFLDIVSGEKAIIETDIKSEEDLIVKGIFYNYDLEKSFSLEIGTMFDVKDLINGKKVAIIGSNFKNSINDKQIKVDGEFYEVVGVLESNKFLDNTVYLNLNSIDKNIAMQGIKLDVGSNYDLYKDLSNHVKKEFNGEVFTSDIESVINPLYVALAESKMHLILGGLAGVSLISLVISIGSYWIDKNKKLIGIESLIGATKLQIALKLWKEYLLVVSLSVILSGALWEVIPLISDFKASLGIGAYVLLVVINIVLSSIAVLLPIIKIIRLDINTIIKENI